MSLAPTSSVVPSPERGGHKRIWGSTGLDDVLPETPLKRPRILDSLKSRTFEGRDDTPKPDKEYYFADGDITLHVSDTVFKVHSFILARGGSSFELRLRHRQEAGGDQIPKQYMLPDNSPMRFRHLLWALYALAPETTQAVQPQNINIDKILDVSFSANRYGYNSLQKWSLDAVHEFLRHLGDQQFLALGNVRLERTFKHAERTSHLELHLYILEKWTSLVSDGTARPADAIDFATRCALPSLRGHTYYTTLLRRREVWDVDESLSSQQRITLLSGFERLVVRWEQLKRALLDLESVPFECDCCSTSTKPLLWNIIIHAECVEKCQSADTLGKLQAAQETLSNLSPYRCSDYMEYASGILQHHITEFQRNLPDFFADAS